MITKNIKKIAAFSVGCAFGAALSSCSDDWNDHYDASTVDNGTLWQAIKSQSELSNFAHVVEACGYDQILDGSQTFTVFAPTNSAFTSSQADSLIERWKAEGGGLKGRSNDNTVVRQFLQNHIALYKYPVSSLTNDSITLMNDKYQVLTATTLGTRRLLSTNALYNNGLLFTLDGPVDYFPNVFEYLGHDAELDSVYRFLNSYTVYEFNDAKSVPGEIVDGQTVYLDSVSDLRNILFEQYGLINSEDSTYWLLCPTNSEWSRLVERYEPYFRYAKNVAKRDSMAYANTRMAIIGGAFFSKTRNPDVAFQDSAVSTLHQPSILNSSTPDYPYYTYYRPFDEGGIFHATSDIVCSNGHVRKASQWHLSPFHTFAQTIKVEAENLQSVDTIYVSQSDAEKIDINEALTIREVTTTNPFYGKVSGNAFAEIKPDPITAQLAVGISVPNVLSGIAYDIYAVFVPATAYDTLAVADTAKPSIVRSYLNYKDENGHTYTRRINGNKTTNPAAVDTVLMVSNYQFPTCCYGLQDAKVRFDVQSNITARQTSTHSSTLRIDCIIFRPSELGDIHEH